MSESNKAAFKFASTHIIEIPHVDEVSDEAVMHNIKFMSHAAGARDFLEWARSKRVVCGDWQEAVVTIEDLESYFGQEKK